MADKPMTKAELVSAIAEQAEITKEQVKVALDTLAKLAYEQADNGFTIPGIGKLVTAERAARKGRNPATGAEMDFPAKKVLKFRIAKAAKDAVECEL